MTRTPRSAIIAGLIITWALIAAVFFSCNKTVAPATYTSVVKCVSCGNNGSCINDTCRCNAGFEGTGCETVSREKFVGNWEVSEKGSITEASQYGISIHSDSSITPASSITIINFFNYFRTPLTASVHLDTLFIPVQSAENKTVVGFGVFTAATSSSNATVALRYKVTDNTTGTVDDFGYDNPSGNPSQWNK